MNNKPGKHKKLEINLEQDVERPESGFKVTLQKPSKIKAYLDAYVIGQERAKKAIAVAVYNHYKGSSISPTILKLSLRRVISYSLVLPGPAKRS